MSLEKFAGTASHEAAQALESIPAHRFALWVRLAIAAYEAVVIEFEVNEPL